MPSPRLWFRSLSLLWLAAGVAACAPSASDAPVVAPGNPLTELADPLGPAGLYANSFTLASSWDPGGPQRSVIFSPLNDDYNVFDRDCRKVKKSAPSLVVIRSPEGCPGSVTGLVMAHATGPGVVSRIWLTTLPILTKHQWEDERLLIYLDRTDKPSYSLTYAELAAGVAPFQEPESGIRSGSWVTYFPLHFKHSLWITLDEPKIKVYYYQANIVSGALPTPSSRVGSVEKPTWKDALAGSLYSASGAGGLQEISFEADSAAADRLRHATLSFAFDGVESAAEIGDLCGSSIEWSAWKTGRMDVSTDKAKNVTCTLRWGWPHAGSGSIHLAATDTTGIRVSTTPIANPTGDPLPEGRFFVYPAAHAVSEPALMQWGLVQGAGRLVALTLQGQGFPDQRLISISQVPLNFLEGDEIIRIDGAVRALGTGTEDLFNGAFYFETGPYSWAWGGVSLVDSIGDLGRVQTTRFFLGADQINFQESFDGQIEIGANHPDIVHDYRTLAIFYLRAR